MSVSLQDSRPDPRQRMNDEKLTFAGAITDCRGMEDENEPDIGQ